MRDRVEDYTDQALIKSTKFSSRNEDFFSGTICAIALGNSTGLPMVLLTVVTQSMSMSSYSI